MPSSPTYFFPSPVGGVPTNIDFAPSIVFALSYACLLPLVGYRAISRRSRCLVLVGAMISCLQRIADSAVRAVEARDPADRTSATLVKWLQISYAVGFIGLGHSLLEMLRCLLVDATKGDLPTDQNVNRTMDMELQSQFKADKGVEGKDIVVVRDSPVDNVTGHTFPPASSLSFLNTTTQDQPNRRRWIQRICMGAALPFLLAMLFGIVAGNFYPKGIAVAVKGQEVQWLRGASTILALIMMQATNVGAFTLWVTNRRIPRNPVLFICTVTCLLSISPIYRLVVMPCKTDALESTAPCSLNSKPSKVTFYIFQLAPEFLTAAILLSVNVRQMFKTGLYGRGEK